MTYAHAIYDQAQLLSELPTHLSADIVFRLYGRLLRQVATPRPPPAADATVLHGRYGCH
jgi:hypothetical protein